VSGQDELGPVAGKIGLADLAGYFEIGPMSNRSDEVESTDRTGLCQQTG